MSQVFPSRLQWRREIEEDETLIAGFIWNGLQLIQLFSARSKMNDAGLGKHGGKVAGGFWSCQTFLKPIKVGPNSAPKVNRLALRFAIRHARGCIAFPSTVDALTLPNHPEPLC